MVIGIWQWPPENDLPGFRETYTQYLGQVEDLSFEFIKLLAESLGLAPDALDIFFHTPRSTMQHRSKVVKYPTVDPESGNQGVGPHYDSGFLTFVRMGPSFCVRDTDVIHSYYKPRIIAVYKSRTTQESG